MRTHAVPAIANTNGSAMSAMAIIATPGQNIAGFFRSPEIVVIKLMPDPPRAHQATRKAGTPAPESAR